MYLLIELFFTHLCPEPSTDDQLELDYFSLPISCEGNEDEDSSGADYFLASSVDTVINAPYLMSRFGAPSKGQPAGATTPVTIPGAVSKNSHGSYASSSYAKSVAKNFLANSDNKVNVNSVSNLGGRGGHPHNNKQHEFSQPMSASGNAVTAMAATSANVNNTSTKGKKSTLIRSIKKFVRKNIENRPRWNKYF